MSDRRTSWMVYEGPCQRCGGSGISRGNFYSDPNVGLDEKLSELMPGRGCAMLLFCCAVVTAILLFVKWLL